MIPKTLRLRLLNRLAEHPCTSGILLVVLLLAALAVTTNNADADLWGHVQYGRDVLSTGQLPATTTYSFTAENYSWINHENLAELILASGMDAFSPIGMVILKSLLGFLVIGIIACKTHRQGAGLLTLSIVMLLAAINLTFHWSMRPQLFTYLYFLLLLCLLDWCFSGWAGTWRLCTTREQRRNAERLNYSIGRLKCLWLAVPLFAIWANTHGGFVAGYCIFAAYLVFRGIEAFSLRGRAAEGLLRRFLLMLAAAGLATLLNPYSFRLHVWLVEAMRNPWPEISEWHAPDLFDPMSRPLVLLLLAFVVTLLATRRRFDFTHLGILALTVWQSLQHQRHAPFFSLAFALWMSPHVASALQRVMSENELKWDAMLRARARWRCVWIAGCAVIFLALAGTIARRMSDLTVFRHEYPVSALQYIADQRLQGNMVVTYDWAQYVIGAFGARDPGQRGIRVAFDGRFNTCYPSEVIDMHFDWALGNLSSEHRCRSTQSGRFDSTRVLDYSRPPYRAPDLVLVARRQPHAVQMMDRQTANWVLLYQDEIAQLWGRATTYDDPRRADYISSAQRVIDGGPQSGRVTWPALPATASMYAPMQRLAIAKQMRYARLEWTNE